MPSARISFDGWWATLIGLAAHEWGSARDGELYQRDIKFVVVSHIDANDPLVRPRIYSIIKASVIWIAAI